MPRPQTAGAGTALAVTDTAWQSIGGRSVPPWLSPVKARGAHEMANKMTICGANSPRNGQSMIEPCAAVVQFATLRELMHRANGNGKLVPAFIAPFAVPPRR